MNNLASQLSSTITKWRASFVPRYDSSQLNSVLRGSVVQGGFWPRGGFVLGGVPSYPVTKGGVLTWGGFCPGGVMSDHPLLLTLAHPAGGVVIITNPRGITPGFFSLGVICGGMFTGVFLVTWLHPSIIHCYSHSHAHLYVITDAWLSLWFLSGNCNAEFDIIAHH